MMQKKLLAFPFFFFSLVFANQSPPIECNPSEQKQLEENKYKSYINDLNDLRSSFASQILDQFGLVQYQDYGGEHGIIEKLGMHFIGKRRATINEARAVHLAVTKKFTEAVNNCEKIRPYLKNNSFNHKNIKITIHFERSNGARDDGTVYRIGNGPEEQSYLLYATRDPFEYSNVKILAETREEALKRNLEAKIEDPTIHKTTPKESAIDRFCSNFQKKMYKKHKLECWSIGGKMSGQIEEFGMHFKVIRRATEQQARALILDIANTLVDAINNDASLAPYLIEKPFPIDRLKIFVGFRTKTYGVYWDTTMEDVVLKEGEISYYQNTPAEVAKARTIIPNHTPIYAKETYDEAMKIQKEIQQKQFLPRLLSLFRKNHAD